MAVMRMVGARVKRVEDPRLITGQSTYVDDIRLVDLLYAAVVRSPIAHGRIKGIDVSRALAAPGVVAVYTARDLHFDGPLPNASTLAGVHTSRADPLCAEKVRMVGDPIAFVVAESRYARAGRRRPGGGGLRGAAGGGGRRAGPAAGGGIVWDNAPGNEAFRKEVGDKEATEAAFRRRPPHGQPAHGQPAPDPQPDGDAGGGRAAGSGARSSSPSGRPARSPTSCAPTWRRCWTCPSTGCG